MVRKALAYQFGKKTELICFSDDMDGLRTLPQTLPNPEKYQEFLHKPLCHIPDPYGKAQSFAQGNNDRLKAFLEAFGFDYTFISAQDAYTSGRFDKMLLKILKHHDKIVNLLLPTLGEKRRKTYSPFLPISPTTGRLLQTKILETHPNHGTVVFQDEQGKLTELPVTGGQCKLQWKADWGMRWAALGIDFEMYGKDLIESAALAEKICKILGEKPPVLSFYELFLDEEGKKISKSKGNGLSMEQWLRYGSKESLLWFLYQHPKRAKRLHLAGIPKAMDDYFTALKTSPSIPPQNLPHHPLWHIHQGNIPSYKTAPTLSFSLLINLASACHVDNPNILWKFIKKYDPNTSENSPVMQQLLQNILHYYQDIFKPLRQPRPPTGKEIKALNALKIAFSNLKTPKEEEIQTTIFQVGKAQGYEKISQWFQCLYEILLGHKQGPRLGSFIFLYGLNNTCLLIDQALCYHANNHSS